jgi:hypothetical protein
MVSDVIPKVKNGNPDGRIYSASAFDRQILPSLYLYRGRTLVASYDYGEIFANITR